MPPVQFRAPDQQTEDVLVRKPNMNSEQWEKEHTGRVKPVQGRERAEAPLVEGSKASLRGSAPEVRFDGGSVSAETAKGDANNGADEEAVREDGVEGEHVLDTKSTVENTGSED